MNSLIFSILLIVAVATSTSVSVLYPFLSFGRVFTIVRASGIYPDFFSIVSFSFCLIQLRGMLLGPAFARLRGKGYQV